jgi:drug/metabolite transporter (DMT)-like permease
MHPLACATSMSRPRPALLLPALGLNVLIASGTFLVAKSTLREFPPLTLALLRFVLASLVLWPLTRWLRPGVRIAREDRGRVALLGLLAVPLNQGLFLVGMKWASASHASLLYALTPAFVALAVAFASRRMPDARAGAGIALAFLGVLTLMVQRGIHFDRHSVAGDGIILIAVVAWALYLAAGRRLILKYGPLVVTAEALGVGTLMYLPLGLIAARNFDPRTISPGGWVGLGYLAWMTSGVNYVIWYWGLAYIRPTSVALLTNLQPIVTAAMAYVILHESLPAGFALAAALVLGGVWLAQSGPPRVAAAPLDASGSGP